MEARIELAYRTLREAEAVARAVSPENVKVPQGLSIKTISQSRRVFTKIECETKLQTFTATIDDLLSAVSVAERALSAVKNG